MTIRNRQDAPSPRSPIACATRSKSLRRHLVFLGLPFLLLVLLATMPSWAQGMPTVAVPAQYFGMSYNKSTSMTFTDTPAVTYGIDRIWDGDAQWLELQTAACPSTGCTSSDFDWTELEDWLENDYNNGVTTAWYTMSRTPNWALGLSGTCSSNPDQPACDTTCNYGVSGGTDANGDAPGQCYPPADLNPDGSGTDQTWKNWVTALATENVALCGDGGYACIQYYEIWNEADRSGQGYPFPGSSYAAPYLSTNSSKIDYGNSYYGSYAQLVRMLQDAKCIIQGRSSLVTVGTTPYAIDNAGGVGVPESCTIVNGIQGYNSSYPATFVSPSSHTVTTPDLNFTQNFLYCTVSNTTASAPNWCNTGEVNNGDVNEVAEEVGVINFHMKPGNESDGFTPETEMLSEYCAIVGYSNAQTECQDYSSDSGVLESAQASKTIWNGESGYSGQSDGWAPLSGQGLDISGNPDMEASFISRYSLVQWSFGIQGSNWYEYDISNVLNGSSDNGSGDQAKDPARAYNALYSWMVGQTMTTACNNVWGTEWACDFSGGSNLPAGYESSAIWNTDSTSYPCNSDSDEGDDCTTFYTTVSSKWTYYRDLWGDEIQIPTTGTYAYQVPTGILPILLENESYQ